jgi:multidrug efflux pump
MATYVAINPTPTANPLSVVKSARKVLKQLETNFPPGLNQTIVYDATAYINDSLNEVERTIGEATLIVIIVIFLFLGSLRTVIIPVVTIPLSLIGAMSIMLMLGYSLNLLTLLAMVLAIGLVVDDAIVVVENVHRHIELGASRFQAAIAGAREIATPVIAMTITLAAVYAPIGFMSGLTGALFTEFAFTLAATVVVSGVIALTLSPMMCSKLFKEEAGAGRYTVWLDAKMDALKELYARILASVLNYRPIVLVCGVILLACCGVFFMMTQSELAPQEDQSMLWMQGTGPDATNIDYTTKFSSQFVPMLEKEKAVLMSFIINGAEGQNSVIGGIRLKPWSQRSQSAGEIGAHLQKVIGNNPGLRVNVVQPSSLPTGSSSFFPISFVIKSTGDFAQLYEVAERMVAKANASGHFLFLINSLRFNKPQVVFNIDRDKAAQMGIDMQTIGDSLGAALSGNYVNRFSMMNQSFEVIPQLERRFRANYEQLENIYIKNMNNEMIPLSNLVRIEQQVEPSSLSQFQQLNSATLEGLAMPGQTNLDGLHYLMGLAKKYFAPGMSFDFSGESRTAIEESNALTVTFFFSLIVIYLVLAAQYESFTDPIIILVSVPMSIFGALLPLFLGAATINIYTQIGLLTLIGLISKHGILMVDFANHLQQVEKLNRREAIIKAASIRLRPILMTTAAMILGVLPLALATGAGAVSRRNIGDVIMAGMSIGTLFTLIVVPTVYSYLAKNHQKELEQAHAG